MDVFTYPLSIETKHLLVISLHTSVMAAQVIYDCHTYTFSSPAENNRFVSRNILCFFYFHLIRLVSSEIAALSPNDTDDFSLLTILETQNFYNTIVLLKITLTARDLQRIAKRSRCLLNTYIHTYIHI